MDQWRIAWTLCGISRLWPWHCTHTPTDIMMMGFHESFFPHRCPPLKSVTSKQSNLAHFHYNDVIMGAIASQISSPTTVYSTTYSDADQRKHQSSASLHKWPVTRENVSIWWRHHVLTIFVIQIRWKFNFALIQIVVKWSLQDFAHGSVAVACAQFCGDMIACDVITS